eukprot:366393-Chlamydomonas_euryale.AAC.1
MPGSRADPTLNPKPPDTPTQPKSDHFIPISEMCFSNTSLGKGLVRKSAEFSADSTYMILTSFLATWSLRV